MMTIQAQVSVQTQVSAFIPRDYDVFAGLDVDHHSIAATFTDHDRLLQSLRLPYSVTQLLNYVQKHFPGPRPSSAESETMSVMFTAQQRKGWVDIISLRRALDLDIGVIVVISYGALRIYGLAHDLPTIQFKTAAAAAKLDAQSVNVSIRNVARPSIRICWLFAAGQRERARSAKPGSKPPRHACTAPAPPHWP